MLTGYNVLFFLGLRYGLAGGGGVLMTGLSPLFVYAVTTVTRRRLPTRLEALGLLLADWEGWPYSCASGTCGSEQLLASGNLFFLVGALLWALLTVFSQRVQADVSYMTYSFYVYAFTAVFAFFLALPRGLRPPTEGAPGFWLNMAYMAVFATAFSSSVYFKASRKLGSRRGVSFMLLVPALALLISWAMLGEVPTLPTLIGGAGMVSAVFLINRSAAPAAVPAARAPGEEGADRRVHAPRRRPYGLRETLPPK